MERVVRVVAPRSWLGYAVKITFFLLLLAALDTVREMLSADQNRETLAQNVLEVLTVGGPLIALALALIGHLDKLQTQLKEIALTDQLTEMPNRRAFLEQLESALAKPDRWTLVMFDIDHFKQVNDTYGHGVGDLCIAQIGRLAMTLLSPKDSAGRLGGEEFAILLAKADQTRISQVAQSLVTGITFTSPEVPQGCVVTCSVGLSDLRIGDTSGSVLARADEALYAAKRAGRARYMWDTALAAEQLYFSRGRSRP